MQPRSQFTFYESFARALKRIKKPADRVKAYDAICDYALYGVEPDLDSLPESVAIALDVIMPVLTSGRRKAAAGSLGGSKPEANRKQTGSNGDLQANRKQE